MAKTESTIVITAVDKTKAAFNSIQSSMKSTAESAAKLGLAVAAVGGAAMTALVVKSLKLGDSLGKVSDKLGIATKDLQGLRLAAEQTGVSSNTLDTALQRQTRRIAEAANGTGVAVGALKDLGISIESIASKDPAEQFKMISDAMGGVASQGEKVRLSMALFDTEGVALVNTLAAGRDGLEAYADQADQLGIALTRIEAKQIEQANDAMNLLGKATEGAGLQITAALAPTLEVLSEKFLALGADSNFWGEATVNAVNTIGPLLAKTAEATNIVSIAWQQVKIGIGEAGEVIMRVLSSLGVISDEWAIAQEAQNESMRESIGESIAKIGTYAETWTGVQQEIAEAQEQSAVLVEDTELRKQEAFQSTSDLIAQNSAGQLADLKKTLAAKKVVSMNEIRLVKAAQKADQQANALKTQQTEAFANAASSVLGSLFEGNKAAAYAGAIIDTSVAIMRALAIYGPTPVGFAAASAAGIAGAAQIATIASTNKEGGGSAPSAPSAPALPTETATDPTLAGGGSSGPTSDISITLEGGAYSDEQVRNLIKQINEQVGDGAQLQVVA